METTTAPGHDAQCGHGEVSGEGEATQHAEHHGGAVGVKQRVAHLLDNHWVELLVLALVLVDVVLVSVEAGIDANFLCIGGKEVPFGSPAGQHLLVDHGASGGHGHASSLLGLQRRRRDLLPDTLAVDDHGHLRGEYPPVLVCEGTESHRVEHLLHNCHLWSVAILCVFTLELLLKLWAIPNFIHNPWHRLDMAVVFLSLFVDTAVMAYINAHKVAGQVNRTQREQMDILMVLLVFLRIWRVVRIAHGLYEFQEKNAERVEMQIEERIHESLSHASHSPSTAAHASSTSARD